jgi:small-conductance mechanosensitive channel
MSQGLIVYLAVVGAITLGIALRLLAWLRITEARNLRRFRAQSKSQPVRTSSPLDDPQGHAEEHAAESIAARFSVTRRLLFPLLLLVAGFIASVPFLGMIPAAMVSLAVGAMTVIAGLALRPVIENSIAGLVISSSKLVNIGDTLLIEEQYGTVEDITVTHTTIKLWDWRRYVVANSRMLQIEFINYSLFDNYVWAYVEFWVDYRADLDEVERLAIEAARSSKAFAEHEEPRFWLMETGPEAVQCWVAAWANSAPDAWRLKHDTRKNLIPALARRGWAPRGHRVHLLGDGAERRPAPPAPGE